MKNPQLMEELDKSIDDKVEKTKFMEGFLGYIICSTQVTINNSLCSPFDSMVHIICESSSNSVYRQEAAVLPPLVAFAVRVQPGMWEFVKVHSEDLSVEEITVSEYLKCKETIFDEKWSVFLL